MERNSTVRYDQQFKFMTIAFWSVIGFLVLVLVAYQVNQAFAFRPRLASAEMQCQQMNETYHAKAIEGKLYCLVPLE